MATRTVRHPFLFVLSTLALLIGVLAMPQASAEESASFMYGRAHAGLIGEGFEPGIDVTITVSDGREFVTTAGPDSSNPSQVAWEFDQPVAPGETITVSSEPAGGAVTKTLLVEEVAITTIRHREDVVEGIAPAGATLNVGPDGEVVTTVASDGTFVADLGAAGFDIQPGADGYAVYAGLDDADGDTSRYDATAPEIIVDPVTDELWLNGFEHHLGIELLLGGDGTPGTAARSLVVEHDGSGDAHLDLHGDFDITPGLDIYAWSPTTIPLVRHHVVTNLTLDPWNDRILSGTADPGSEVCIDVFGVGETCVIADGGTWSYDPGVEGAAAVAQYDDDDDSTQLRSAGAPWFLADQVWDDLWGHGFAPNASVDVSVDGTLFGSFPTDRGGYFAVDPGSIPLDIGSVVEVTDGAATKTLTLSNLLVTDVDVATDTVSGTGTPGAEIWIGDPFDPDYAASRTVTVQSDGTWFADFTVPGDGGATWDFQPGDEGFTHQSDADGDVTHVRWRASVPPWVTADPGTDAVWGGGGWQGGVPITVTIDDPGTAVSPDFSGTTELGTYPDNPDEFYLEPGFDIQPGFTVEATDGVATKILFVTSLQITDIDFDNDLVSGTADDGLQVWIDGGNDEEIDWAFRVVDVVGGSFTADFGNPGPMEHEQDTVDLVPGSRGTAQQYDDDGDYTHAFWHTEVPETPWMTVDPDSDSVWGGGSWEIGVPITVTIDDPATADAPDFTGTTEMLPTEWDPGYHEFWLDTGFDILSGFTVEATDGVTTKSLLVADIHDIVLDPTTAIVTGYAVPGTWVNVNLGNDAEWAWRDVPTDATGFFSADLGTPVAEGESGDGVMTVPLPEGTGGAVQQTDDDGDGTHVGLCHGCGGGDEEFYGFAVFPEDDFLQVEGWWEAGRDLTITIATDEAFTDVLLSETVFNEHGHLHFAPEFDIQRGMWIAVDDGLVRREHRVQNLYVDGHDEIGDTVYGRADVGTVVIVQAHFDGGIESVRHVYAGADADDGVLDGLGPWLADFSVEGTEPDVYEGPQIVFDIGAPGSGVTSEQRQGGGETDVSFGFPLPFFQVDPEADFVWGQEWPEGATVTISVYQDETLGTLLHEQTAPVERWGDNSWDVGFDAELGFDVQAGQFVTVTDGDVVKTLAVSALSGVTFDPDTGVVSGSTDPYAWVEVNVGNDFEWAWRNLHVDDTGSFSVDFSAPPGPDQDGDGVITTPVAEGTGGDVRIPDEDRDATAAGFCHGCGDGHEGPRIRASLTDDWISLEEWSDDLSVTVEIPGLFGPES
ncbi:MAG: hypothetical protein R3290_10745, partial [Acidimicrobiia bacterium]|nr:hypothetical protein [Acidimicrobiia bacterium]